MIRSPKWNLSSPDTPDFACSFDEEQWLYTWRHPDPRMDALQTAIASFVQEATGVFSSQKQFGKILALYDHYVKLPGRQFGTLPPDSPPKAVPRLTEDWFC